MTDGEFLPDQKFDKHYSFDLTFHKDVFVDELGVDFIDLGIDYTGNFKIKIFRNDSILNETSTLFGLNFNQIAYFNINYFFQDGLTYTFQIINLDIYTNNDNKITLFKPNELPYTESADGIFTTSNLKSSSDTIQPFDKSDYCPFVHIGTTTQNYISFGTGEYNDFKSETPESNSRSSIFKLINNNIKINKIGIENYDTGLDNLGSILFEIKDLSDNQIIYSKDSTFINIHKSLISLDGEFELKPQIEYEIKATFNSLDNKDDLIYLYQPSKLPFKDNTGNIEIIELLKNIESDSFTLPFILFFDDISLKINENFNPYRKIIIKTSKNQFFQHITANFSKITKIELYSLNGSLINMNYITKDNSIELDFIGDETNFQILKIQFENSKYDTILLKR